MNPINLFAVSALVNGIVSITFGILVISKNWRDRMNQIFFLMTIALAVWSFSYWQWQLSTDYDTAMMWVKILSIGSLFIPIFFYHWVIKLVNADIIINKIILWFSYITVVSILFFVNSNLFIADLERKSFFQFWPSSGVAYDIYFSYIYFGLILYTVYILLRSYHIVEDRNKKGQILYVIISCVIGFGGVMTDFPLWWGINIPPYGNILAAVFPFLLGYSILRYKLFNIRAIIAELLVFSLVVFMLIIVLLADNWILRLVYGLFFILTSAVGVILIRNSYTVDNLNKSLESANKNLSELSKHLSQKVAEQTEDIRHAYEVEKKARHDLEKLNDSKNQFIMITQHHLRTPVTAIDCELEAMQGGVYGQITPELKTAIVDAQIASRRLTRIIDDFLNIAALKAGGSILNLSHRSLKSSIEDIINELKLDINRLRVKITYPKNDADWPQLTCDCDKIQEILLIVMENAVKYNHAGGSIDIRTKTHDNQFEISIENSGMGITSEETEKIGSALFYRGSSARGANPTGMGIGLSVAKAVIRAHHGTFSIKSDGAGKGAVVTVTLPLKQPFGE